MRISDWSSDVCSSDLSVDVQDALHPQQVAAAARHQGLQPAHPDVPGERFVAGQHERAEGGVVPVSMVMVMMMIVIVIGVVVIMRVVVHVLDGVIRLLAQPAHHVGALRLRVRSEEHTSELQSLMRISYAVFCLKKKKHNK